MHADDETHNNFNKEVGIELKGEMERMCERMWFDLKAFSCLKFFCHHYYFELDEVS